jgi:hypothetical protein
LGDENPTFFQRYVIFFKGNVTFVGGKAILGNGAGFERGVVRGVND